MFRTDWTPTSGHTLAAVLFACSLFFVATSAGAEEAAEAEEAGETVESEQPAGNQVHVLSSFALRAIPIGTQLNVDGGYRFSLFDSDSMLLKDTYVEAGATTFNSPSYFWGGGYIEAVPVAVLQLRASAHWMNYYGTFGYLHMPANPDEPDWSLDALDGDASAGQSSSGYVLTAEATLRAKVGNIVAMVPFQFRHISMDVDENYYESTFDMLLEPDDQMWTARPMLAYVFVLEDFDSWILTGARWEHAQTIGTEITRDMPGGLALWKLPGSLADGEMKLALVGGYWLNHPNRQDTVYAASQFSVEWLF
jgi:hypothetical protein